MGRFYRDDAGAVAADMVFLSALAIGMALATAASLGASAAASGRADGDDRASISTALTAAWPADAAVVGHTDL